MNTSLEERKAMGELAVKSLFKNAMNIIPIAGPILSDVLFEFRNKIKQERLFKFVDLIKEHFSKENPDINIDNATSEEFSDLFESVLNKVSKTRNEKKMESFKNLLLRGMKSKDEINDCELFSELLLGLTEVEVELLDKHEMILYHGVSPFKKKRELKNELENYKKNEGFLKLQENWMPKNNYLVKPRNEIDIENDLEQVKKLIEEYKKTFNYKSFDISKGQYQYAIQSLSNKGLLVDEGVGSIGTSPFESMGITDFGIKFLQFIKFN